MTYMKNHVLLGDGHNNMRLLSGAGALKKESFFREYFSIEFIRIEVLILWISQ